jgi:hypothetical protein
MPHRATPDFWEGYQTLPQEIRNRADQKFLLLKANQQHPSLQFKKLESAKVSGFGLVTMTPTIS